NAERALRMRMAFSLGRLRLVAGRAAEVTTSTALGSADGVVLDATEPLPLYVDRRAHEKTNGADVAEPVDARDLKSLVEIRAGSIPAVRTSRFGLAICDCQQNDNHLRSLMAPSRQRQR